MDATRAMRGARERLALRYTSPRGSMSLRTGVIITCAALAVSAPAAAAATLKVTVDPTVVHRNQTYAITISGRYHSRYQRGTPYLLAFIQYSGSPCWPTATTEYKLPASEWSWLIWPQSQWVVTHTSFKRVYYEQARTRYGNRRVCAYLYSTNVTPQTTETPIVRAGAPYTEVK